MLNKLTKEPMKDKSLTTKQIAVYCQVTQRTAVQWISEGKLKFFRTPGKHIRVNRNDFIEFLNTYHMPVPKELDVAFHSNGVKKVLIVDDDKDMVASIQRVLNNENKFVLDVAYDGFEAGQKFIMFNPDLIILDIRMPRVDGYKLCMAIRNNPQHKHIKILIVSGLLEAKDKDFVRKLGADDYLLKPFENQELKTKIADLFGWNKRAEDIMEGEK